MPANRYPRATSPVAFHSTFSPWISPMNDSAAPKPQNAAACQNRRSMMNATIANVEATTVDGVTLYDLSVATSGTVTA
jgi:hypothetical protein